LEQPGFFRRHVVEPLLQLLRIGATPRQLAWSIAIGAVIGINPLLGSTTLLALALTPIFRLNIVASQLGNHIMYPLELLLFPVFVHLGIILFHTSALPLDRRALLHAVKFHPWDTTKLLWSWEWHALIVWAAVAVVVAPLLQRMLLPALQHMLQRLHREPVVEQ
jgi:uncharacterized protein (DUF2062 family)